MSVAPGDCNPTRAVCRFIAQSRARTGSFCGSVKGRPASLYVGWVSEAHPPGLAILLNHGLSPLTRGTLANHPAVIARNRFIPARAGNTSDIEGRNMIAAVYPRSRGEHCGNISMNNGIYGLSPLARGTPLDAVGLKQFARFIPARAGNTPVGR